MKTTITTQLNVRNLLKTKWKDQFNYPQLEEIRTGIGQGLDVSIYANPEFGALQMWEIRVGLQQGLDVSSFAKPEYEWEQMNEIRNKLQKQTY